MEKQIRAEIQEKQTIVERPKGSLVHELEEYLGIMFENDFTKIQHKFNLSNEDFLSILSEIKQHEFKSVHDVFQFVENELGEEEIKKINSLFFIDSHERKEFLNNRLPKELIEILDKNDSYSVENILSEIKSKNIPLGELDKIAPSEFITDLFNKFFMDNIREVIFSKIFEKKSHSLFIKRLKSINQYNEKLISTIESENSFDYNTIAICSFLGLNIINIPVIISEICFNSIGSNVIDLKEEKTIKEILQNSVSEKVAILSISDLGFCEDENVQVNPFYDYLAEHSINKKYYHKSNIKGNYLKMLPLSVFLDANKKLEKLDIDDERVKEIESSINEYSNGIVDFSNSFCFEIFSSFEGIKGFSVLCWKDVYLKKSYALLFKDKRDEGSLIEVIDDILKLKNLI